MKKPHTISVFECIYEGEEKEEKLLSVSRLNDEGKMLHREQFDDEGNLIKKEENQYEGELVALKREEDLIENKITQTMCAYEDGKLVNQKDYLNDELLIEMIYAYNEDGKLIQNDILNNDGSANSSYSYEYLDRTTTEKFFDEEMTLVRMIETVHDDDGQIVEKRITECYDDGDVVVSQNIEHKVVEGESIKNYYTNGEETHEVVECFDEQGRIFQTITYDVAKDEESIATMTYDERGNVTKEEITKDDEEISVTVVKFDEYDNRVEMVVKSKLADDFYETSTYKFVNEYNGEG